MQAEIITIGDELLIGQTINTNAAWIGNELSLIGIPVKFCTTISDEEKTILQTIDLAFSRSQLIIVTGGLGPTKDDITKETLCKYFETELEINPNALFRIEKYFEARNRKMLDVNVQQAALPKSCKVIDNFQGTACGMWFDKNGAVLVSIPGVPYEMKAMMTNELLPVFKDKFQVSSIFHKTIISTGIGESYLAEIMSDWEDEIRNQGLGLAYLPSPGIVRLRITSDRGETDLKLIDGFFTEIQKRIPQHIFGYENETLIEVVSNLLKSKNKTVGTVESCTGGAIASMLTSISGASNYFLGSLITYSNELKNELANVNLETIKHFGAVSEECVREMAMEGQKKLGVDYCISCSGIAGPEGGTADKPVGEVWISIATKQGVISKKYNFGDNRERNIQMTVLASLNLLRCVVLEIIE
jgi:nicotinamide-nucleotide amidase